MPKQIYLIALLLLLFVACSSPPPKARAKKSEVMDLVDTNTYQSVSLIKLIADPKTHNNQKVRVEGFFHSEFEGIAIYVNQDDFDYGMDKNALWVNPISRAQFHDFKKYNNHYVLIEGRFNNGMKGHDGAYSGSILQVTRIQILHKRD